MAPKLSCFQVKNFLNGRAGLPKLGDLYCVPLLIMGAWLTGLSAVLMGYLFQQASVLGHWLFTNHIYWLLLATPVMAVVVCWLTHKVFFYSEGSGIPQVISSLRTHSTRSIASQLLGLRVVMGKLLLSPLAILVGMSLGREGPTVQIGASIMYGCRQLYHRQSDFCDKLFIVAGAGAGLAAAFNAPIAGLVFTIEELSVRFWQRMVLVVWLVILIALATVQYCDGDFLYFGQVSTKQHGLILLPAVLVTGGACGLIAGLFNYLVLNAWRWQRRYTLRVALLCGFAVGGLNVVTHNATFGDGGEHAYQLLHGLTETTWYYGIAKWLATLFTYLCGIPGGLFSPSLSAAAGLATILQSWLPSIALPELVLLCMVAYLAGMTQAPLTSLVMTLELTGNTLFTLPLMAVALIGAVVARQIAPPLYSALAATRYSSVNRSI